MERGILFANVVLSLKGKRHGDSLSYRSSFRC